MMMQARTFIRSLRRAARISISRRERGMRSRMMQQVMMIWNVSINLTFLECFMRFCVIEPCGDVFHIWYVTRAVGDFSNLVVVLSVQKRIIGSLNMMCFLISVSLWIPLKMRFTFSISVEQNAIPSGRAGHKTKTNHSRDEHGARRKQHPNAKVEETEELDVHVVEGFLNQGGGLWSVLDSEVFRVGSSRVLNSSDDLACFRTFGLVYNQMNSRLESNTHSDSFDPTVARPTRG